MMIMLYSWFVMYFQNKKQIQNQTRSEKQISDLVTRCTIAINETTKNDDNDDICLNSLP